eukprot:TRINITY_DN6902_c0_g1_i2.p1 TRINITY_DN6902_c0_g1~~TRINITY_DN6902_c0_g1_i2.p1  ORF type:complete len:450 (+),score=133.96 TRINITY_DN6902_c0_g1_i2:82-1431(+)
MARCGGTEWEQLVSEHTQLTALLHSVAAGLKRARALARSVQRRLSEAVAERNATDAGAECAELARVLASAASQLQLELLLEPAGLRRSVHLPTDSTVAGLRAAARDVGGCPPIIQELSVGGTVVMSSGSTALRDTGLVRPGACVVVRRRDARQSRVSASSSHVAVLLDTGRVRCFPSHATPVCDGAASSVHAGRSWCTAAVVGGRIAVHRALGMVHEGMQVECCTVAGDSGEFTAAAVDVAGHLHVWSYSRSVKVPAEVQGKVASACLYLGCAVAALVDGGVVEMQLRVGDDATLVLAPGHVPDGPPFGPFFAPPDETALRVVARRRIGAVASVSAGRMHYAALLLDGTVRCFGGNASGQCSVPADLRDVVSCDCGAEFTVALLADGSLRWWGKVPKHQLIDDAGRCVAVAAGPCYTAVITAGGRLVLDGERVPVSYDDSELRRCVLPT